MIKSSQGLRGEELLRLQGKPLTENSLPGLSLDLRTPVLAGLLPRPTIRAEPGSVVPKGTQVTISCEGIAGAFEFFLYKGGRKDSWWSQTPLYPGNRAHWFIPSIEMNHAGQYNCSFSSHAGWSEHSDSLELVVTGIYNSKPQLLALPTPLVTSAENLTLHCVSQEGYDMLVLTEEGEQNLSMSLDSQHSPIWKSQALFTLGPLIPNSRRTFRCYGYNKTDPHRASTGGWHRCYGAQSLSSQWVVPSDVLDILITGLGTYQAILIRVSVVFFLLFLLISLLLRWRCQDKCRKELQSEINDIQLPEVAEEPVPRERGPQTSICLAVTIFLVSQKDI
ncbi:leukocyte immunoglobulin-like receptor subfamily A member 5 [Nannospalax galili]|uniref:leukocyte immunoglobulin-like receptor subfamily A member 5 n=1 Tax=Nannospalax galili TaxID=1026970 RepID=UPI00111BDD65|nr:leukocyte immunoglobulin-like receptor subfamily A member 5 [Nannospalax galili]